MTYSFSSDLVAWSSELVLVSVGLATLVAVEANTGAPMSPRRGACVVALAAVSAVLLSPSFISDSKMRLEYTDEGVDGKSACAVCNEKNRYVKGLR